MLSRYPAAYLGTTMNRSPEESLTAEALSKRGESKRRNGDLAGARADFDRAVELDPACAAGYSGRGLVKQFTGDPDGALLDYGKALELRPDWTAIKHMMKTVKRSIRAAAKGGVAGESAPNSKTSNRAVPAGEKVVLVRAAFADEAAWSALCQSIRVQDPDRLLDLAWIEDRANDGMSAGEVAELMGNGALQGFALIVDETSLATPEQPILVVDLRETPGRTFRVAPAQLGEVVANLSIGNMDFEEFASAAGREGVFRGFA